MRIAFHLVSGVLCTNPAPSLQEEDNLRDALRFSSAMLSELRTSQLTPQKYYELYMLVFDQLVNLEVRTRNR